MRLGVRTLVLLGAALQIPALGSTAFGQEDSADLLRVSGSVSFHFLTDGTFSVSVKGDEDEDPTDDFATMTIAPGSTVSPVSAEGTRAEGTIALSGAIILDHAGGQTVLVDPVLRLIEGQWVLTHGGSGEEAFALRHPRRGGDDSLVGGYLVAGELLAATPGLEGLRGRILAQVVADAELSSELLGDAEQLGRGALQPEATRVAAGENSAINIGCSRIGLDSGGNGDDFAYYGESGGLRAFSLASTACNYGTGQAEWIQGHPGGSQGRHPLIGQNMYRLQNGRFEQVGQSWLKHSFCAVSEPTCGSCVDDGSCNLLGVGCADTYWATLNDGASGGSKTLISPQGLQSQGGTHTTSGALPAGPTAIRGRIQVKTTDQVTGTPATNGGVMYFAEIQYVTHDEPRQNRNNNCSWRQVYFPTTGSMAGTGVGQSSVHAQEQTIEAWKDNDPQVQLVHVYETVGQPHGRYTVGYRATDNGDDTWTYEYAVHNMNGDRGIGSFGVPIPAGVTVTGEGFHDIDYHSGDPYDGTDWPSVVENGFITWSTATFAENVNANAIRWGTLYNFRFTADSPPVAATLELGLFKPGSPTEIAALAVGPDVAVACKTDAACADLDNNGVRDDACMWWECNAGACNGTNVSLGDYGGPFGDCIPDATVDGSDAFHSLNCFANHDTTGLPEDEYPCEPNPPAAMNVDAAGLGAPCTPDGVCDAHDFFTALNVFEGSSTCSCAGPAPGLEPKTSARVHLTLVSAAPAAKPGELVRVTVHLDQALADLRGYQLHVEAHGGLSGRLDLVEMAIEKRKDAALADEWRAFNLHSAQLAAGLSSPGVPSAAGAYLATLTFRASDDAAGVFLVDLRLPDAGGRSALFTTPADQRLEVVDTTPSRIEISTGLSRVRVSKR